MPDPYYGATIDGVRGKLPHRTISTTTKPNQAQVDQFLTEISNRVAARIGAVDTILDVDRRAQITAAAQGLVHLGAASLTEAAGAPEHADSEAQTSYSSWLWARFESGLTELGKTADGLVPPDTTDDPDLSAGSPVWSFPNTLAHGRATTSWESW